MIDHRILVIDRIRDEITVLEKRIADGDAEIKRLELQLKELRKKRGARAGRLADMRRALRSTAQ